MSWNDELYNDGVSVEQLLRAMYGDTANLWYYGLHSGIAPVQAAEGFQQGDSLATWAYAMTVQPMVNYLQDIFFFSRRPGSYIS